ncbi:MAG: glutamate--tRNA ligase, partial [Acidimicrobiia bacterium]|nr:glutamate--tRNA ligase [Acidimicrobiia bacterium]
MSSQPRLRIAPSPTGQLHVGTARTALYNYLYARHIGGHFAMRIEDTDVERSKREHADAFCDMLRWMGIDWDGDIIYQSDRFTLYRKAIDSLLEQNLAYECFETQEELEAINIERKANKLAPGYDGSAKNLTEEQKQVFRDAGRSRTVRFATPSEGISEFIDAIRGTVKVQWSSVSDFIIERSDGTPTFFLANAVDDIDMGITHVIRGDDLIDSTHRVLALRRALGNSEQPFYAHTPMILATDKSKLSKRHGAVSLESYKDLGYLPAAMVNYLALLGWAPGDDREIVSLKEMVDEFDVEHVNHSGAIFDIKKLEWMNGEYIRKTNLEELIATVEPSAKFKYG